MSDKAKELAEYQGSIAAAITAYGDAAMRFAEGHSTLKEHELIPARRHLEKLIDATVPLGMYERVRRERDFAAAELTRLAEENAALKRRYTWAANELLACDYGDNDAPGEQVGWHVYGWRHRKDGVDRRIYGPSIDAAIDAALGAKDKGE